MKLRRRGILLLATLILIGTAVTAVVVHGLLRRERPVNAGRIVAAVEAYARDRARAGAPLPAAVGVRELVSQGYLRARDVAGFGTDDVTFRLQPAGAEDRPGSVLVSARHPDGTVTLGLSDGSVQQAIPGSMESKE